MKKSKGNPAARFSDAVKAAAVARWRAGEETMSAIARSVGTSQQSVRAWADAADARDKAAKREARTHSAPAEPAAKPNGSAAKPAQKGLLELTQELRFHMEAVKRIKGQLRKLLD